MVYALPLNNPNPLMQTPTLSKRASRMLFGTNTASSRGGNSSSDGFGSTSTHRSRSTTSRNSGVDAGALSGVDTISSAGHSLAHASPTSPRSPMSPCTPSSPPFSPARSEGGYGLPPPAMEDYSDDRLASRLNEARNNSRSLAAMASPRPAHSPPALSRVMAMREQLEARERQAKAAADEEERVKGESNSSLVLTGSPLVTSEAWHVPPWGYHARPGPHITLLHYGKHLSRLILGVVTPVADKVGPLTARHFKPVRHDVAQRPAPSAGAERVRRASSATYSQCRPAQVSAASLC